MVSCVPQHVVVPPREFMWATQSVAISALPHPGALAFLRSQGIASILFLTPKHPLKYDLQDDLRDYFASTRHRWLHVDKAKGQGKVVASEATIKAGLEFVIAAPKPLLVSGFDGVETAALLVACLRKLQCWDMTSIQNELQRMIPVDLDVLHIRFINAFCTLPPVTPAAHLQRQSRGSFTLQTLSAHSHHPLKLPNRQSIPSWLWYGFTSPASMLLGQEIDEDDNRSYSDDWHPTMRIAYERSHIVESAEYDAGRMLVDEDQDPLPTPKCASSATSPQRGGSYLSARAGAGPRPLGDF